MSSSTFHIGLSGLDSFSKAISVTSDNIANSATTGFKSNTVLFGDMVSNYYANGTTTGDKMGAGTTVLGTLKDFTQGSIDNTSTWTNVALNGDGFFAVKLAGDTTTYYTRDGNFSLDADGYLVNAEGYQVLGNDGSAIQVDTSLYSDLYVDTTGQIYGTNGDGDVVTVGNPLLLSKFSNQNGMIRQGSNLYEAGGEVGTVTTNASGTIDVTVKGSALELSNVDLSTEMVNLIIYQADYNANAKSISTANDTLNNVINLVR